MLQATICGNLGADATRQGSGSNQFISFRVAHTDRWTDQAGQQHSDTTWVDVTMNGDSKVFDYLKKGTTVLVVGSVRLRVYSSEKERCMKAGMSIHARQVELLGGNSDEVPRRLFDKDGIQHDIVKYYHSDLQNTTLRALNGGEFAVDENGWVRPVQPQVAPAPSSVANANGPQQQANNIQGDYDGF